MIPRAEAYRAAVTLLRDGTVRPVQTHRADGVRRHFDHEQGSASARLSTTRSFDEKIEGALVQT